MNGVEAKTALARLGDRAMPGRLEVFSATPEDGAAAKPYAFLRDTRITALAAHTDDFGMQWTELFDDYRHDRYKHFEQFMRLGLVPAVLAGKSVLDAGMGLGRLSEIALGTAELVVGCDLSASVHTAARFIDNPRFIPIQASIADLPLADRSFDIVFSWGVVQFCPDPFAALDELWRVLKPGGTLSVWVYNTSASWRRRSYLNWHLKDLDQHAMLDLATGLTDLAHMVKLNSSYVADGLTSELCFSIKGSKEYTRHVLYDGLGPNFHHLIDDAAFSRWAAGKGAEVSFRPEAPITAVMRKPG